jgi:hypothetical protein
VLVAVDANLDNNAGGELDMKEHVAGALAELRDGVLVLAQGEHVQEFRMLEDEERHLLESGENRPIGDKKFGKKSRFERFILLDQRRNHQIKVAGKEHVIKPGSGWRIAADNVIRDFVLAEKRDNIRAMELLEYGDREDTTLGKDKINTI